MVGNNALCYEGIQRLFRNTVVDFLRARMRAVFPGDYAVRLTKPFGGNWGKAAKNAAEARAQGGTATQIKDDFDLLGVNHFYTLFEEYYDKIFSAAAGHPTSRPKPSKPKLLGNLKGIKDSRDPLSHPVEEEISYEEAFGLLNDAKQVLIALGLVDKAEEVAKLLGGLEGVGEETSDSLLVRLPTQDSVYIDFVGRELLLGEIRAWYSDPYNRRCNLAGDGGKGKSAVAYRYAQSVVQAPGDFKLVLWLSAKRRRFQQGNVITVEAPDFTDSDSAVNRLLREFGALDEDLAKPFGDRRRLLLDYLDTFPAFLIIDDIDTVLEDYQVVGLFTSDVPNTRSSVLLTSRRDIPGTRSMIVEGFAPTEAEQFIRSRVSLYGLDPTAFPSTVSKEICRVCDCSPLYIDDLMRLVKVMDVRKAIAMWAEKQGDEARKYALQRELEKLTPDAKKVLIAAAVTDDPVSFAEIQSVLSIGDDRLVSCLTELQTLFLMPKPSLVEGEQRFQLNANTRKLVRLVEGASDSYGRIETSSKALRGKLPDIGRGIVGTLIRQAYLLFSTGRYQEAETLMLNAAHKYPQIGDLEGFLGFLYRKWDRIADARLHFEAAYKLKCKNEETYHHWVKMELGQKEWSRAIDAAEKCLKLLPNLYGMIQLKAEALLKLGLDFSARLQREKAERPWRQAVEELRVALKSPEALAPGERDTSAQMYRTLIICLDLLGDIKGLNHFFSQWKSEHPDDPNVARQADFIARKRGALFTARA
ncbi:MAG: tetratricopeptide repeat protein [Bradyrhizobium sp.]|nr:tetratricopeptide repeat protein [Bradyrhizobium sp.]